MSSDGVGVSLRLPVDGGKEEVVAEDGLNGLEPSLCLFAVLILWDRRR
jgi:hypothetical protein